MDRRVSGSEFHIAGPDTEKARVLNCVLVRWMTNDDEWWWMHRIRFWLGLCPDPSQTPMGSGAAPPPPHFLMHKNVKNPIHDVSNWKHNIIVMADAGHYCNKTWSINSHHDKSLPTSCMQWG